MPDKRFQPRAWLRNAHLQSILPSLPPRRYWTSWRARALRASAEPWLLDCGAGVRLRAEYSPGAAALNRTAVLLHGWEGRTDSCYVLSMGALLHRAGYGIVRLALRDHHRTQALNRGLFHSCRLSDVTGALRAIAARCGATPLYLAGFSLGGNFLLRACAEPALPQTVRAVVAISPVLDPDRTLHALETGWPVYHRYFVRRWSRSLRYKQRCWPTARLRGSHCARGPAADDRRAGARARIFRTGLLPDGYAITGARLLHWACRPHPRRQDDRSFPPPICRLAPTPLLRVTRCGHGGHCGFLTSLYASAYCDQFALEQFEVLGRGDRRLQLSRSSS